MKKKKAIGETGEIEETGKIGKMGKLRGSAAFSMRAVTS